MKYLILLPIMAGVLFIFVIYVVGSLRVDGKQCGYVQVNWAFKIDAHDCQ